MNTQLTKKRKVEPANTLECCICLDDYKTLCEFLPCKHQCVCLKCFINSDITPAIEACPLCRTEINHCYHYDLSNPENNFQSLDGRDDFYKFVISYMKILPKMLNVSGIIETIVHAYQSVVEKYALPCLLSAHQTEDILTRLKQAGHPEHEKSYKLLNLFVCLCVTGWEVDVKLGDCGVCYFGNMGGKITCVKKFIDRIHDHHNMVMEYEENGFF